MPIKAIFTIIFVIKTLIRVSIARGRMAHAHKKSQNNLRALA